MHEIILKDETGKQVASGLVKSERFENVRVLLYQGTYYALETGVYKGGGRFVAYYVETKPPVTMEF